MAASEKKRKSAPKESRKGQYYEPHPLDYELLQRMPEEGAMLGYHTLGMTVKHALKELNKDVPLAARLTAEEVSARVRSMHVVGYVAKVKLLGTGGTLGWQRTPKGTAFYEEQTGKKLRTTPELRPVEGGGGL